MFWGFQNAKSLGFWNLNLQLWLLPQWQFMSCDHVWRLRQDVTFTTYALTRIHAGAGKSANGHAFQKLSLEKDLMWIYSFFGILSSYLSESCGGYAEVHVRSVTNSSSF